MNLITEPYLAQQPHWPQSGKHILAQYDEHSIIVYQAYRPAIGRFAATHGYFGDEFSMTRMSWVKPNFLWMMYRSGWGTKEGQEITLAIRLKRSAFDTLLTEAVHSTYQEQLYQDMNTWKKRVEQSSVRLQWDPDHDPSGARLERRAIQLGLRGPMLASYAHEWVLDIEDISAFVREQYEYVRTRSYERLLIPQEREYIVNSALARNLGVE